MSIRNVGFRLSIIDETLTFESFMHRCNIDGILFNEYVFLALRCIEEFSQGDFVNVVMPLHTNG